MISEISRDTEDWSNDAENVALHLDNKLHFKIYKIYLNCNNISQHYWFLLHFFIKQMQPWWV